MARQNLHHYYFPHLRRGLGARLNDDAVSDQRELRAKVNVNLQVESLPRKGAPIPRDIQQAISLYGPGDVLGFDTAKIVLRSQPTAYDPNFAENNVPFVEFKEPDFPWRYSAVKEEGHWIPWLSLIVLERPSIDHPGEFKELESKGNGLPLRIEVEQGVRLPDLSAAWRWAHVHCNAEAGQRFSQVAEGIKRGTTVAVARLVAARKLEAGKPYAAFVIPTYKLGLEAALGIDAKDTETDRRDLSWSDTASTSTELIFREGIPYYYRWEFQTGSRGDFEQLVRLISPKPLSNLGGRKINIDNPGFGLRTADTEPIRIAEIDGALMTADRNDGPVEVERNSEGWRLKDDLAHIINSERVGNANGHLRVVPPIYGRMVNHASADRVILDPTILVANRATRNWLEALNLDIRYRIAAGLGVQYVKENQEKLMKEAWAQLEKHQEENRKLRLARFGREISKCYHKRINQIRTSSKYLSFIAPAAAKINATPSFWSNIQGTGTIPITGNDNVIGTTVSQELNASDFANVHANLKFRKYAGGDSNRALSIVGNQESTYLQKSTIVSSTRLSQFTASERKWTAATAPPANVPNLSVLKDQVAEKLNPKLTIEGPLRVNRSILTQHQLTDIFHEPYKDDPIRPIMFYPQFREPMYKYLRDLSEEYFLPGLDKIPENSISLVLTNRPFIESFLMGLNHEFALELRWRGYPTDMRGSYFRKFWDTTIYSLDLPEREAFRDSDAGGALAEQLGFDRSSEQQWINTEQAFFNLKDAVIAKAYEEAVENWMLSREEDRDIAKLERWRPPTNLGEHQVDAARFGDNNLVLLIRAEVLSRFPNTFIYMVRRAAIDNATSTSLDFTEDDIEYPIFEAELPPDIVCLGFAVTEPVAREHYIIFEERQSEQRYGLDIGASAAGTDNLNWSDFVGGAPNNPSQAFPDGDYLDNTQPRTSQPEARQHWNNPAFIARAFAQKPVRMVVDLDSLLPK